MLYRFKIELSDIDRGVYQSLDFRLAQHPSEALPYLLTRTLAYCMSYQDGLEFSPKGLGDPDGPAIHVLGQNGVIELWVEIGNPSVRKLHRASKAAKQVVVYTYKNADALMAEIAAGDIHKAESLEVYSFDSKALLELEKCLEKNNSWSLMVQEGQMNIGAGTKSVLMERKTFSRKP